MSLLARILGLALRNTRRNRARTGLTLGAIGFGVMMTVLLGGFSRGLTRVMEDDTIKGRTGALQVHRKGYFDVKENQPLKLDIEEHAEVEKKILATQGVAAVTARIFFAALLSNGAQATTVIVQAVDPVQEPIVLPFQTGEVRGSVVRADKPNGALLVAELAKAMGAKPGDTLALQGASPQGRQNALDLEVVGTINNSNAVEPKKVMYVPLDFAQRLLGMQGRVTEYVISLEDRDALPEVRERLLATLGPDYEVQTWREVRPQLADVIHFLETVFSAVSVVFLIIATFGVVNTMLMSVMERTREIGTLLALGVRRKLVGLLFLLEALCLAVLGSAGGAAVGVGVVVAIAGAGGVGSTAPGSTMVLYIVPYAPVELVSVAMGAATVAALVAAVYPALRAASLRPVDALRAT
ncbi:MAG: transporter, permease protein [Myxococcaceae bacterium]|nr:transporter, permease protein [Myxococcaceae bacterium]